MKKWTLILVFWYGIFLFGEINPELRPQMYAAYKAQTILPPTLQILVKKNSKYLFHGVKLGFFTPVERIHKQVILQETRRITEMVNQQQPFKNVVAQMGYVSGLLALYTNPGIQADTTVRNGFQFYLNFKLDRFLFVFDGYQKERPEFDWLMDELQKMDQRGTSYSTLLEKKYREVDADSYFVFDERSAVFGVCSLYFSNLARLSAHCWFYAWRQANGDISKTPFTEKAKAREQTVNAPMQSAKKSD